jgi:DNA repair exonuclease SbcCD ATPase subunit
MGCRSQPSGTSWRWTSTGAACNVLLFDEVMGTIDLGRMEQTVNFYDSLLTGAVDTIVCISHRAELKEYFPLVWSVRKEAFWGSSHS